MSVEPATILTVDENHAVLAWRDVMVAIWRRDVTLEAIAGLRTMTAQSVAKRPRGVALAAIIEEHAHMLRAEQRAAMTALLDEQAANIRAAASILEGDGFRAAAARSVITGLSLVLRPAYPLRVFARFADAGDWLAKACSHTLERGFEGAELAVAVEAARARIAAQS